MLQSHSGSGAGLARAGENTSLKLQFVQFSSAELCPSSAISAAAPGATPASEHGISVKQGWELHWQPLQSQALSSPVPTLPKGAANSTLNSRYNQV